MIFRTAARAGQRSRRRRTVRRTNAQKNRPTCAAAEGLIVPVAGRRSHANRRRTGASRISAASSGRTGCRRALNGHRARRQLQVTLARDARESVAPRRASQSGGSPPWRGPARRGRPRRRSRSVTTRRATGSCRSRRPRDRGHRADHRDRWLAARELAASTFARARAYCSE